VEVQMSMQTVSQAEQALAELAERFSHWRRNRTNAHERIPAPLWDQAVALSRVLPNGQVAKALGLGATDLRKRRLAQQARLPPIQAPGTEAPFIEVTPERQGWVGGPSGTHVELERPDGLRMHIRYGSEPAGLSEVVRAFVEGGRCFS
jgi:hypothetical protein